MLLNLHQVVIGSYIKPTHTIYHSTSTCTWRTHCVISASCQLPFYKKKNYIHLIYSDWQTRDRETFWGVHLHIPAARRSAGAHTDCEPQTCSSLTGNVHLRSVRLNTTKSYTKLCITVNRIQCTELCFDIWRRLMVHRRGFHHTELNDRDWIRHWRFYISSFVQIHQLYLSHLLS